MVCRYTRALEGCMQIAFAGEMAKRRAGSIRWIERSCRLCGGQFGFRAGPCHINRLQQTREQQYGGEIESRKAVQRERCGALQNASRTGPPRLQKSETRRLRRPQEKGQRRPCSSHSASWCTAPTSREGRCVPSSRA